MNELYLSLLKATRTVYQCVFGKPHVGQGHLPECIMDAKVASDEIYKLLSSNAPCMIARYGAFELSTVVNYLGVANYKFSVCEFIKGNAPDPIWNKALLGYMQNNAGFFPTTEENIIKFCKLMIEDTKHLDLLGSWTWNDLYMIQFFKKNFISVHIHLLEPFWNMDDPWTKALTGKKVLIVHPFNELIEKQYSENRSKLFTNPNLLPQFELKTIKAVQSIGGVSNGFKDWFEALAWMQSEIDKYDYDICLLGCGAYGFPLAAHCKRMGKKAIHLGGALQLLFGIRGKRWENPEYGVEAWDIQRGAYLNLMNEHWVRPGEHQMNNNTKNVEGGCYW